jgi:CRP/FNR family transcriptional regulator, cyclic AMP receptor protein
MKEKGRSFDGQTFLSKIDGGKSTAQYAPRKAVFRQGDPADSIFYIEKGKIKLRIVSKRGKEAVVGILGAGDFLGEGCLAGELRRMATATPLSECTIIRFEKELAVRTLRDDPEFAERFLAYLLARNIRIQEDLVPVKRGWHECSCCWPLLGKRANRIG